jgi:hypothetical protein
VETKSPVVRSHTMIVLSSLPVAQYLSVALMAGACQGLQGLLFAVKRQ